MDLLAGPSGAKHVAPAWPAGGTRVRGDLMFWFQCLSLFGLDGFCGLKGTCPGLCMSTQIVLTNPQTERQKADFLPFWKLQGDHQGAGRLGSQ